MSVAEIASKFQVGQLVAFTESGFTARKMSRYRPEALNYCSYTNGGNNRALAINWGVKPVICKFMSTRSVMMDYAELIARENGVEIR